MSISVLICDDDSLIRESLKILLPLKGDIKIEAEAADGQEAIDICTSKQIDVALIDIRMPKINGPEAIKQIVKRTDTKCLVLTTFDEDEYKKIIKDMQMLDFPEELIRSIKEGIAD